MDKKQLQQLLVIIPIVLVAGIFGYYKYLLPFERKKRRYSPVKWKPSKGIRRVPFARSRLPKLKEEIGQLNLEIAKIQKRLPPNKDIPI